MKRRSTIVTPAVLLLAMVMLGGCFHWGGPTDSFPATNEEVQAAWAAMEENEVELQRPLVVIDGWVPIGSDNIIGKMKKVTEPDDMIVKRAYLPIFSTLESNARAIIDEVEERWPSDDPVWTTEVDVIGFSMGGIIGRVAALPPKNEKKPRKRLKIRTLYSLTAPHQGSKAPLSWIPVDEMSFSVGAWGRSRLTELDEVQAEQGYHMLCYGQTNDWMCRIAAAPPGYSMILSKGNIPFSHEDTCRNVRLFADMARRLRGETPLAPDPPAPDFSKLKPADEPSDEPSDETDPVDDDGA